MPTERKLAPPSRDVAEARYYMEALNKWLEDPAHSESKSVLLFLLVYLTRVAIDHWDRHRERRRHPKRKGPIHG